MDRACRDAPYRGLMERRTIAATAAAVFLTTAAGVLAVTANLGLLHVSASESKVGTLGPVELPAPSATPDRPAALTPVTAATPAPAPAPAAVSPAAVTTSFTDGATSPVTTATTPTAAIAPPAPPTTLATPRVDGPVATHTEPGDD
jgi:hypothetical protein